MVSVSVRVSAKAFWFASQFKANNDIRYYLNSVQIKKHPEKGAFVAGCDGHVIGIYHDPLAEFSCEENEIIVSLSADAARHIKPTSRIKHDRFVSIEGTRAKVVHVSARDSKSACRYALDTDENRKYFDVLKVVQR